MDDVYTCLSGQGHVQPGRVVLLLSMFASATYSWTQRDCEGTTFTLAEVSMQTPFWIKATQDVLDVVQRSACLSLEAIQGLIIVSLVVANLEGISQRYRSLLSMGLMMGRELGLHRLDHPDNTEGAKTIQAEVGRRVWWSLASTDWLLAAKFTGPTEGVYQTNPRQMALRKPLNVNDEDLCDGVNPIEQPVSYPTAMSYFLQRIRLAEIARDIVDRNSFARSRSGGPSYSEIMAIDADLERFMHDMPPFFKLDDDSLSTFVRTDSALTPSIVMQACMLNTMIHTQRCKLHLPYLARGSADTTYAYSRETCLRAARFIIRVEMQLEKESLQLVLTRLKFAGFLHTVFMASIVLLMDVCATGSASQQIMGRGGVADAFRILEAASVQSVTAANLLDSLMHVLREHNVPCPRFKTLQQQWLGSTKEQQRWEALPTQNVPITGKPHPFVETSEARVVLDGDGGHGSIETLERLPGEDGLSSYFDELTQADLDSFDWESIFSELESSFPY